MRQKRMSLLSNNIYNPLEYDPIQAVANLFDVAMVFAVSLMIAIVSYAGMQEFLLSGKDVTVVKNPGSKDMEIIMKKGQKIEKFKMSEQKGAGKGQRLGVAYRLESGEIVYVPEDIGGKQ